jgi:hypothetical protein
MCSAAAIAAGGATDWQPSTARRRTIEVPPGAGPRATRPRGFEPLTFGSVDAPRPFNSLGLRENRSRSSGRSGSRTARLVPVLVPAEGQCRCAASGARAHRLCARDATRKLVAPPRNCAPVTDHEAGYATAVLRRRQGLHQGCVAVRTSAPARRPRGPSAETKEATRHLSRHAPCQRKPCSGSRRGRRELEDRAAFVGPSRAPSNRHDARRAADPSEPTSDAVADADAAAEELEAPWPSSAMPVPCR